MKYQKYKEYQNPGINWLMRIPKNWDCKKLKYFTTVNDETLSETTSPDFEFNYVDIGSIDPIKGIIKKEKLVFEDAPSRARRIVREGDVVISTVRTYLRAIAPIRKNENDLIVSTGFAVIRPRDINNNFLSYALKSIFFVNKVVSLSIGVNYPAISSTKLSNIKIPIPINNTEQKSIAHFLDRETSRIDALIEKKRKLIELLKEKRTALITRAVTKGLDPNVKMKDSGIEWLGEIPEHWILTPLRHLIKKINNGTTTTQTDQNNNTVPVTRIETISEGKINWKKVGWIEPLRKDKKYLMNKGDILFSHINSLPLIGNTAALESYEHLYHGMNLLRLQPNGSVNYKWLLYYLKSKCTRNTFAAFAKPAINQASLPTSVIKSFPIPVPPKNEQEDIANYINKKLNKIDKLIYKNELSIKKYQEYRTALISAAVTGKIKVSSDGE